MRIQRLNTNDEFVADDLMGLKPVDQGEVGFRDQTQDVVEA